jgi:EAL domain-containing protein (putative c-di-GMP-specific phosphodiesterase class I)
MYQAKTSGKSRFAFFDPPMAAAMLRRHDLREELAKAVERKEIIVEYQPIVELESGQISAAEALVRWEHPVRGRIPPSEFIALAEETGLIMPLGEYVLEAACRQLAAWARQPEMMRLELAVNVSACQFRHPDFVETVLDILDRTRADPRKLKLELTESMLVANVDEITAKMSILKARGVGFSLDDFGTGYSSLSYLKRLPLDQLKIDQSFIRDVLTDPNDAAIARTIVALGQSLGLAVIAEGVETEMQREFLARNNCHAYQGYLFSEPLALPEFEAFIREAAAAPALAARSGLR